VLKTLKLEDLITKETKKIRSLISPESMHNRTDSHRCGRARRRPCCCSALNASTYRPLSHLPARAPPPPYYPAAEHPHLPVRLSESLPPKPPTAAALLLPPQPRHCSEPLSFPRRRATRRHPALPVSLPRHPVTSAPPPHDPHPPQ
jgi:hypothetical protein